MKKYRFYQIVTGAVYVLLIIGFTILSLQNGTKSEITSSQVSEVIADVGSAISGKDVVVTPHFDYMVRKIVGHYLYFVAIGLFGALFIYSFKKPKLAYRILILYFIGYLFAFVTEYLFQKLATNRTPQMKDVFIDYLGYITLSMVITIFYIVKFIKNDKIKQQSLNESKNER